MTNPPLLTQTNVQSYIAEALAGKPLSAELVAQVLLRVQDAATLRYVKEYAAEEKRASTTLPAALGPFFTYAEWKKDHALRRQWAKTWELPHMKAGLQVLFSMGVPSTMKDLSPGVAFDQFQLVRSGRYEGYFDALKQIETLKKEPPKKGDKPVDGWGSANLNPTPEE